MERKRKQLIPKESQIKFFERKRNLLTRQEKTLMLKLDAIGRRNCYEAIFTSHGKAL